MVNKNRSPGTKLMVKSEKGFESNHAVTSRYSFIPYAELSEELKLNCPNITPQLDQILSLKSISGTMVVGIGSTTGVTGTGWVPYKIVPILIRTTKTFTPFTALGNNATSLEECIGLQTSGNPFEVVAKSGVAPDVTISGAAFSFASGKCRFQFSKKQVQDITSESLNANPRVNYYLGVACYKPDNATTSTVEVRMHVDYHCSLSENNRLLRRAVG